MPQEFGYGMLSEQVERSLSPMGYVVLHRGEFITAIRDSSAQTAVVLPELKRQTGKIHAVYFAKLNCVILNMHLSWDKINSENARLTNEDLKLIISHLRVSYPGSYVFLAGDGNRVPEGLPASQQTDP